MKRFHVHLAVADLAASIRFYSTLFGAPPDVHKSDYAKWMVDDPRINFAISARGSRPGVNHLGFQVDTDAELEGMRGRLEAADAGLVRENAANCCYAISDKYWVTDPQGIAWETYHTLGSIPVFGAGARDAEENGQGHCCAPGDAVGEVTGSVAGTSCQPSLAATDPTAAPASSAQSGCCAPPVAVIEAPIPLQPRRHAG